ncbi:zinc finger protein 697 [Schistocerca piceifrons]|uniref:zinc finger protein 697 n=1 Tax=Schistocerca piceifrons TaxID=274613 RepID=UPI001F5EDB93|nr:zinc finger protein 697 [Schistocerca piceifrons]
MPRAFLVTARRYSSGAPTPAPATDLPQHRVRQIISARGVRLAGRCPGKSRRVSTGCRRQPAAHCDEAGRPPSQQPPQLVTQPRACRDRPAGVAAPHPINQIQAFWTRPIALALHPGKPPARGIRKYGIKGGRALSSWPRSRAATTTARLLVGEQVASLADAFSPPRRDSSIVWPLGASLGPDSGAWSPTSPLLAALGAVFTRAVAPRQPVAATCCVGPPGSRSRGGRPAPTASAALYISTVTYPCSALSVLASLMRVNNPRPRARLFAAPPSGRRSVRHLPLAVPLGERGSRRQKPEARGQRAPGIALVAPLQPARTPAAAHASPAPAFGCPPRKSSPERRVSLAEAQPAAESASASAPVSVAPPQPQPLAVCLPLPEPAPDDLYNLTQLAEVSLAAAAGRLFCWTDADDRPHTVGHGLPPAPADRAAAAATGEPCVPAQPTPTPETAAQPHQPPELAQHACPDCGKRYSTASNLARHRQTHRGPADAKARRCAHCGKVYVSVPAFSMHVRTHAQACRCPYCGKCFSRPWLLQGHIRTHTGEKPFKCTICEKAFADKSNLRAHVQTHSSTKPHVCCRCGKAFALKSYLYKHEESSCVRLHSRAPQCAGVVGAA